jgi:tetratricopeptide (TPR) repeat protein
MPLSDDIFTFIKMKRGGSMMTKEEFNQWREWLRTESSIRPPEIVASNYWQYHCRASLARFLMRDEIYEPAFRLMETVVEQIPDEDDHYAWALSDLGCLYWRVHRDKQQAIHHLNKALEVLDTTEQNRKELSFFSEGGKYLRYKLSILHQSGETEKAKEEALSEIQRYQDKYSTVKSNSYIFNGYLFLADVEESEGNLPLAIEYMKKGLSASEYAAECLRVCDNNRDGNEQLFSELMSLSHSMIVYFEV